MQTTFACGLRRENQGRKHMAVYHLSVKTISRSAGRSGTGAAAYRAGEEIYDERTGYTHDYTRKSGVEYSEIVLPDSAPEWATDRAALWNAAEQAETRKNSTVAREFEIALPAELSVEERQRLAVDFAKEIVERHGCAADVAIHAPGKGGDNRNHHAHILCSTRRLTPEGFTKKTRELDERKSGEVDRWRERFAELQNERFQENGIDAQVDHRSLKAQGIDREPTEHLGVAATGYERRTGQASDKRLAFEREAAERLAKAKEMGEMEREAKELESSIIDLSGKLSEAKAERDHQKQNETQLHVERLKVGLMPTERLTEREKVNRALNGLLLSKKRPLEPEKPVLRQEVRLPPQKPELSPVELAEQTMERFFKDAREIWQKETASRYSQEAAGLTKQYWKLKEEEPKEPLLFKKKEWQRQHGNWADKVNGIAAEVKSKKQIAEVVNSGKFEANQNQIWGWSQKAQERLEKERPELARALKDKRLTEQQEAKEKAVLDKAVSAFKSLAVKREGKFLGYQDGGKKWESIPDNLKNAVESYNKQPDTVRGAVLGRMRENLKLNPGEAEKLTERLEQGKYQDRGAER